MKKHHYKIPAILWVFLIIAINFSNNEVTSQEPIDDKKTILPIKETTAHNQKLTLSSDEIIYNADTNTTTAVGNVKMSYNGYYVTSDKITYYRKTGRIIANGNIELIEKNGNRLHANHIDITDNFSDGFIQELTIKMPNNTYLSAKSATRIAREERAIFNHGMYTACSACYSPKTSFPPFWAVKSKRIIQNDRTHTIRLEKAYFELFGTSVAYLPVIEIPDNTISRQTGFLFPKIVYSGPQQGIGFQIPYYQVISRSADATLTVTPYPTAGIFSELEFRKHFRNGIHTLRAAYMYTLNNQKPAPDNTTTNHQAMLSSTAKFEINPNWIFGWDGMVQSNNHFSYNYNITDSSSRIRENKIYLTGLGEKTYLNLRTSHFATQVPSSDDNQFAQGNIYFLIDYDYIEPKSFAGGELSLNGNLTAFSRPNPSKPNDNYNEIWIPSGVNSRVSAELEWKKNFITPLGIIATPSIALRGDIHNAPTRSFTPSSRIEPPDFLDNSSNQKTFMRSMVMPGIKLLDFLDNSSDRKTFMRSMVTPGIETRYPFLIIAKSSRHVLEGIAQLYLRTNELYAGMIPNEDAQSLVLNSNSLFRRDKFSGYDRMEGGIRTNLGLRYTGYFNNLYTIHGIIGQSIHLAGQNSFASADVIGIEENSGLNDERSDYVGAISVITPYNLMLSVQMLTDSKTLGLRSMDANLNYSNDIWAANLGYTHITDHPKQNQYFSRDILKSSFELKLNESFSATTSSTWNLRKQNIFSDNVHSLGLSYRNDCAVFDISYEHIPNNPSRNWRINANLGLRTIGNLGVSSNMY
ncbi:LPS-assembly protein LptD [Candidatus Liberibacter sp.]|uniref:LPS-assembly protein LptD n=1 Tax=Candidatus Liberibacter sp. TaxID=34022 RepID=UPI0015F44FB7|nr:LPS assembly protein LptD [Candidatus Liberibacter sp.]MBA5724227.1 LPS-assembly protein LptD [Candidatus Liberibacter sp.]